MSSEIQPSHSTSRANGNSGDSLAREHLVQEGRRIELILSFLDDPSVIIRERAARALQSVESVSPSTATALMNALVTEMDPLVKRTLIELIPRLEDRRTEFISILLAYLSSPQYDISIAAATTLGALGKDAEHAFIPVGALVLGETQVARDSRVCAFMEALPDEASELFREYREWIEGVTTEPPISNQQISLRTARTKPLDLLARETALNVCLGSQKMACRFLDVWIKTTEGVSLPKESGFIEAALAFKIREVSQKPQNEAATKKFYEGCRSTRLKSGLEYALAVAPRRDDALTEAHLDFTIAQLGRGLIQREALARLISSLWSARQKHIRHLGSNVAVLSESLEEHECGGVLRQVWQLYDARKDESPAVKAAVLSVISQIPDSGDYSLERFSTLAQDDMSGNTRMQLLRCVASLQGTSLEMESRKRALLDYLSK